MAPRIPIAIWADEQKHRQEGETFDQKCARVAGALTDNKEHYYYFKTLLREQRFLPGGRIQAAAGSYRRVTAFNCFVSGTIEDSMDSITDRFKEAAETMRLGGGIGYDFSNIRPKKSRIRSLGSQASGPVSFMGVFDALCKTIKSAGHRRGAQMACLRVDHPDIMEFITAKANGTNLTQFNMSVLITNKFMEAVKKDTDFDLVFEGVVYDTVRARSLWDAILRNTWDWAEPGVIFVDRINEMNNLWYIEDISATNPCGEQPLPPYGACLLGSLNLTMFIYFDEQGKAHFNYTLLKADLPHIVRAMDNVIDETVYPIPQQEQEAKAKRRIGIGITGLANALGVLGLEYGSVEAQEWTRNIMRIITNGLYMESAKLAKEKGPFPLYDEAYLRSKFVQKLDPEVIEAIRKYGIRNSHLTSIAPTGTISLAANNISSGIEPVFSYVYTRDVDTGNGISKEVVEDFAFREWGIKCKTANETTVQEHVAMFVAAQEWVDSACSKTCNVGDDVTWEEFKEVYMQAFDGGAKGCTTFRAAGKRFGILNASTSEDVVEQTEKEDETVIEGGACYLDPVTGLKTCDSI